MPVQGQTGLVIQCGGSVFRADLEAIHRWRGLLDCADQISLTRDGQELVRVRLGGLRRWIAFKQWAAGSPLYGIGFQTTVGATRYGSEYSGGSNFQVVARLHPDGLVDIR